jgi:hypothetical protein
MRTVTVREQGGSLQRAGTGPAPVRTVERERCGPRVEARNAPWYLPEWYSGAFGSGYEATCAVTRFEKAVSRVWTPG